MVSVVLRGGYVSSIFVGGGGGRGRGVDSVVSEESGIGKFIPSSLAGPYSSSHLSMPLVLQSDRLSFDVGEGVVVGLLSFLSIFCLGW